MRNNNKEIVYNIDRCILLIPYILITGILIYFDKEEIVAQYIKYFILIKILLAAFFIKINNRIYKFILFLIIIFFFSLIITYIKNKNLRTIDKINKNHYVYVTGKIVKIDKFKNNKNIILLKVIENSKNLSLDKIKIYTYKLPKNIYTSDIIKTKVYIIKENKSNDNLSKRYIRYLKIKNISANAYTVSNIELIKRKKFLYYYIDKIRNDLYLNFQLKFGNNDITSVISALSIGYKNLFSEKLKNNIRNIAPEQSKEINRN